ncbi:MAG: hypothetical protein ACPGLV_13935, partial [Bacteroidia bacterium]
MGANIYRVLLIISLIASLADAYSQCNINDRGTNLQVKANQYPYTVFYKNDPHGSFNYARNLNLALDSFRLNLRKLVKNGKGDIPRDINAEVPYDVFKRLFDDAYAPIVDYRAIGRVKNNGDTVWSTKEDERRAAFSWQIKAKSFVLLCATNLQGNSLPPDSLQLLRVDLDEMFETIDYNYPAFCTACGLKDAVESDFKNWTMIGQYVSKNMIHYLQAYDLYMADAYLQKKDTDRADSIRCDIGKELQQFVRDFYKEGQSFLGVLSRDNDNHTLMHAGVLGLASIVLNDIGDSRVEPNKHPEKWFENAMWRIDKTMWDETGRAESKRGDKYGFATIDFADTGQFGIQLIPPKQARKIQGFSFQIGARLG